jgi:hypothetical protein
MNEYFRILNIRYKILDLISLTNADGNGDKLNPLLEYYNITDEGIEGIICSCCNKKLPIYKFKNYYNNSSGNPSSFCEDCYRKKQIYNGLKFSLRQDYPIPITEKLGRVKKLDHKYFIKLHCTKCKLWDTINEWCNKDTICPYSLRDKIIFKYEDISMGELNEREKKIDCLLTDEIIDFKILLFDFDKKVKEKLKHLKTKGNDKHDASEH